MNLETRISKVEEKTNPQGNYPYELTVRYITDPEEAAESKRRHGIDPSAMGWVTYGDDK